MQSMGVVEPSSVFSQRRDILMSAAAVAQASVPADRTAVWSWDITRPLPFSTKVRCAPSRFERHPTPSLVP